MPPSCTVGRPRGVAVVAEDLARELTGIAAQLASIKGEANAWLSDERYDALRHRLEDAHASVEAVAVEARGAECGSTRDAARSEHHGGHRDGRGDSSRIHRADIR